MNSPDRLRFGQVGRVLMEHSPDPDRHPLEAAVLALVYGGTSEAKTVFNKRHHPDFAQNVGESGLIFDGRDHPGSLRNDGSAYPQAQAQSIQTVPYDLL